MTIALWCVLVAGLLPYFAVAIAKATPGYNNADPRNLPVDTAAFRKRAHGAHLNSFEAFPLFAVSVLVAILAHAPQARLDALALAFVLARLVYIGVYIANRPTLRSTVWVVGFACTLGIFLSAL